MTHMMSRDLLECDLTSIAMHFGNCAIFQREIDPLRNRAGYKNVDQDMAAIAGRCAACRNSMVLMRSLRFPPVWLRCLADAAAHRGFICNVGTARSSMIPDCYAPVRILGGRLIVFTSRD